MKFLWRRRFIYHIPGAYLAYINLYKNWKFQDLFWKQHLWLFTQCRLCPYAFSWDDYFDRLSFLLLLCMNFQFLCTQITLIAQLSSLNSSPWTVKYSWYLAIFLLLCAKEVTVVTTSQERSRNKRKICKAGDFGIYQWTSAFKNW